MRSDSVAKTVDFIIANLRSQEGLRVRGFPSSPSALRTTLRVRERVSLEGGSTRENRLLARIHRTAIESLHPDPLRAKSAGEVRLPIEVFMPMHMKDASMAHLAVAALRTSFDHPLRSITICIPDQSQIPTWAAAHGVRIVRDADMLSQLGSSGGQLASLPGWSLQQVLKLGYSLCSDSPVLVQCADTVLLRPRVWISAKTQILPLRFKPPRHFGRSTSRLLGDEACLRHSSSVTHHQLMQPEVIRETFSFCGDATAKLESWIIDNTNGDLPAEYQVYGSQLRLTKPKGWVPAGWHHGNGKVTSAAARTLPELSPSEAFESVSKLRAAFPSLYGLSVHVRG